MTGKPQQVEVFSSSSDVARLAEVVARLLREMPGSMALAFTLARRDFRVRYLQNLLGVVWAMLSPLVYALIFVVIRYGMKDQGLEIDTAGVPAALFALIGIVFYQCWIEGLMLQLQVLRSNKGIIQTFHVPPETYFFSAFFFSLFSLGFRLLVIVGALLYFQVPLPATAFWFPLLAIGVVLTGNVLGLILAPVASLYRDIREGVQAISLGILLCSPVFYPPATDPDSILYWVNVVNPFAAVVATTRDSLVGGSFVLLAPALFWLGFCVVAVWVMFVVQRVIFRILAERVG